jgi:hypothetical protein
METTTALDPHEAALERNAKAFEQREKALEILAPVLEREGMARDDQTLEAVAKSLVEDMREQEAFAGRIAEILAGEGLTADDLSWERLATLILDLDARRTKSMAAAAKANSDLAKVSHAEERADNAARAMASRSLATAAVLAKILGRPHRLLSAYGPDVHAELKAVFIECGGDASLLPAPEVDAHREKIEAQEIANAGVDRA